MERNVRCVGISVDWSVWQRSQGVVSVAVITAWESFGNRKSAFQTLVRLDASIGPLPKLGSLLRFNRWPERFRDDFKIFAPSFRFFNRLLRSCVFVGSPSIGARASPGSLSGGELNTCQHS